MSKVIFVDIDGPLLPIRAYAMTPNVPAMERRFDPCAVGMLNRLTDVSGAKLVISSNWVLRYDRAPMLNIFRSNGISGTFHDDWTTPRDDNSGSWSRSKEVLDWVAKHPEVRRWISWDDEVIDHDNAITVTIEDGMTNRLYIRSAMGLFGVDEIEADRILWC